MLSGFEPLVQESSSQRRRGVTASRAKLTHALADAGLRTQSALAERIADIEGLEVAPKDAVSRAFRELSVDLQTLERIAQALNVEVYSLYKTADEPALPGQPVDEFPKPANRQRMIAAGLLFLLLISVGWWFATVRPPAGDAAEQGAAQVSSALDIGTPTVLVMPLEGDEPLAQLLRDELANTFSVATITANVLTQSLDPGAIADKLRVDAVVDGDIATVGRLAGLRFYLYTNGMRQQIWAESHPVVALAESGAATARRAAQAIKRATGFPVPEGALPPHFPLAPVQDDYLAGELYLDKPSNELNIKRAQSRFEAALRQDSNYARAHAGLCQALLEEYWMSDEERALKDAGLACGQAIQLDPDDPVVAAAHAHYLRRTGRNDEAIKMYEQVVAENPLDATAWSGLASSRLDAYRQSGDAAVLALAKKAASNAAEVDPEIWKPLFALATMEYFDGNVDGAIAASEQAFARDRNEYVAANLGTFYLCNGSYGKAVETYLLAQELAPGSYVGDEFLGMAYYFAGNYEESARLRQRAIDSISNGEPEIHEMWGNLGDSYRQMGRTELAIDAYLKAAEIAERDYLRGTAPAADRAARAYYYMMLNRLDDDLVSDAIEQSLLGKLDEIDAALVSATAHRRMAQIWLMQGDIDKAQRSLDRATATCRGYSGLPDLKPLVEQRQTTKNAR